MVVTEKTTAAIDRACPSADARRHEAFERLASEELGASYQLAARILGHRDGAEDAVHEAVVKAWTAFGSLRDSELFEPWFRRIVVNVCRNHLRHGRVLKLEPLMAEHDGRRDEADPLESGALRDAVSLAIGWLGPDLRIAVVLRYWKGLSVQEIARATGVPGGTFKWRLHNANARMRKELDRLGWEVGR